MRKHRSQSTVCCPPKKRLRASLVGVWLEWQQVAYDGVPSGDLCGSVKGAINCTFFALRQRVKDSAGPRTQFNLKGGWMKSNVLNALLNVEKNGQGTAPPPNMVAGKWRQVWFAAVAKSIQSAVPSVEQPRGALCSGKPTDGGGRFWEASPDPVFLKTGHCQALSAFSMLRSVLLLGGGGAFLFFKKKVSSLLQDSKARL